MQNNRPVTDVVNRLNKRNKVKFISTFDFSTLFTKLPNNKLLIVLHHLIDFCFDGEQNKFIRFKKIGARWVKEVKKNSKVQVSCFNIAEVMSIIVVSEFKIRKRRWQLGID